MNAGPSRLFWNVLSQPARGSAPFPESIEEGRTGWSFRAGDVANLARALVLARDIADAQLAGMSAACRVLVSRAFSEHAYFEAMSALYEDLRV